MWSTACDGNVLMRSAAGDAQPHDVSDDGETDVACGDDADAANAADGANADDSDDDVGSSDEGGAADACMNTPTMRPVTRIVGCLLVSSRWCWSGCLLVSC